MDKKLKAKWVKALRSGKYEQCSGALHKGGGYCCFGVLLRVVGESTIGDSIGASGELKFGISSNDRCKLEHMNDGTFGQKPRSFKQIADYIEKRKHL